MRQQRFLEEQSPVLPHRAADHSTHHPPGSRSLPPQPRGVTAHTNFQAFDDRKGEFPHHGFYILRSTNGTCFNTTLSPTARHSPFITAHLASVQAPRVTRSSTANTSQPRATLSTRRRVRTSTIFASTDRAETKLGHFLPVLQLRSP
jgi:hypothetical protein